MSIAARNLFCDSWRGLDQADLRIVLKERILGGHGQYDGDDEDTIHLPAAGDCRVSLRYKGNNIVSIEPGPAFDQAQWDAVCAEIKTSVLNGPQKVGRDLSFSSHHVNGHWRGANSGVQILPPPDGAPLAYEGGQNPFILEFPLQEASFFDLNNARRIRAYRKLTQVLNLLLAGNITRFTGRNRSFWTNISGAEGEYRWVTEFYFADFGPIFVDELSPPTGPRLEELPSDNYYGIGLDGRGMRVPDDLDNSIYRYQHLSPALKAKFDRTAYWMSMASRQWTDSMSASFASLVIAAEALGDKSVCGATQRFHSFFERYAPDPGLKKRRSDMYNLRSKIVHGSELMLLDQDLSFSWDPPWRKQQTLNWDLWTLTQTAARNWLRSQPIEEYFRVVRHILDGKGRLVERAVLSGQHGTRNEAFAALELETTKNSSWRFNPESDDWRMTSKAAGTHLLMIDPF
jgi:Apea-like HEPN